MTIEESKKITNALREAIENLSAFLNSSAHDQQIPENEMLPAKLEPREVNG